MGTAAAIGCETSSSGGTVATGGNDACGGWDRSLACSNPIGVTAADEATGVVLWVC